MASRLRTNAVPRISFFSFQDIITSVTGILTLVTLVLTFYVNSSIPTATEDPRLRQELDALLDELTRLKAQNRTTEDVVHALDESHDPTRLGEEIRTWQDQVATLSNRWANLRVASGELSRANALKAEQLGLSVVRVQAGAVDRALADTQASNATLTTVTRSLESLERELKNKADVATNQHRLWLLPDLAGASLQPVLVTVSASNLVCERFNQASNRLVIPVADVAARLPEALRRWDRARDYFVFYVRPSGVPLFLRSKAIAADAGFEVGADVVEENKEIIFSNPAVP